MSNTRASKPPAKYSDCVTGAELDDIIRNQSKQGDPKVHLQIDGKTNNVTFKTKELEKWKKAVVNFFGEDKTHVDNEKVGLCVIKVNYKENTSVKFNFYSTGSVNIQGSTCASFKSQYFGQLDTIVQRMTEESPSDETKLMKVDDSNTDASTRTPNEQSENTGASNQCTEDYTQNEQPKNTGASNHCTAETIQNELIETSVNASNPVTVNFTQNEQSENKTLNKNKAQTDLQKENINKPAECVKKSYCNSTKPTRLCQPPR